jgi:xanthine dehydrogenase/oxidase
MYALLILANIIIPSLSLMPSSPCCCRWHAAFSSINADKALAIAGVLAFVSANDVPGKNIEGGDFADEQIFASEFVVAHNQPIGLIVAETRLIARTAAKLVEVEYEQLPAILTIQDAIQAQSFHNMWCPDKIERGNVDGAFAQSDHVIEGDFTLGGQEHYYLEPHASIVIPRENNEWQVFAATQDTAGVQSQISIALGVAKSKVHVQTKRIGGGFGGKGSRHFVSSMTAVAAARTKRAVKLVLDRVEDFSTTGNRAPYWAQYKAACNKDGKLTALEIKFYVNAGYAHDISVWMVSESLRNMDNSYYIPNVRGFAYACKTNVTSMKAYVDSSSSSNARTNNAIVTHANACDWLCATHGVECAVLERLRRLSSQSVSSSDWLVLPASMRMCSRRSTCIAKAC